MSLLLVVLGTIFQLGLAVFLFMLFSMGAGAGKNAILTLGMVGAPVSCLVSAGLVIHSYQIDGPSSAYWWYTMPLLIAFFMIVLSVKAK